MLVNEALVREARWDDPIGKPIRHYETILPVHHIYLYRLEELILLVYLFKDPMTRQQKSPHGVHLRAL